MMEVIGLEEGKSSLAGKGKPVGCHIGEDLKKKKDTISVAMKEENQ